MRTRDPATLARLRKVKHRYLQMKERYEQAHAYDLLRQKDRLFRQILDTIPIGVFVFDTNEKPILMNPAAAEVWGEKESQFQYLTPSDMVAWWAATGKRIGPDEWPGGQALKEGKPVIGAVVNIQAFDGKRKTILVSAVPIIEKGRITGAIVTNLDITPQRRVTEELEIIKRRFELILNAAGEGIYGMDAQGKAIFANPATFRMTGFTFEELEGHRLHPIVHHSHPDGTPIPPEECAVQQTLLDGKTRHVGIDTMWRKDGTWFPVERVISPIIEEGKVTGAVVIFQDITQREQERIQHEQFETLKRTEALKDQFLSILSHELRTPINIITGFGSILDDEIPGPLSSEQHEFLRKMLGAADSLLKLVNDLLDMTRIQAGRFQLFVETMDFAQVVRSVIQNLTPLANQKHQKLIDAVSANIPMMQGDAQRIGQVLSNLIGNAIKFTQDGGTIEIRARVEGSNLVCEVADNGMGIAPENLPKLFQRFSQLDMSNTRRIGGTGLGLSISKALIEAHGGTISASSPGLNLGTTLRFTLPIAGKPSGAR